MLNTFTAKYTKVASGYMGQLVEWPEVITEGKNLDDCRLSLQDALQEMIAAYRQQDKGISAGGGLIEHIQVKRHRLFDRITANQVCKQAGVQAKF